MATTTIVRLGVTPAYPTGTRLRRSVMWYKEGSERRNDLPSNATILAFDGTNVSVLNLEGEVQLDYPMEFIRDLGGNSYAGGSAKLQFLTLVNEL